MEAKIFSVQDAFFHINKTNPPQLVVSSSGQVNSSGWHGGRLVPWIYITQPEDGIQDFDFIATAPNGMVLWAMSYLSASGVIELEGWMKGIRIHASNNSIIAMLDDKSSIVEARIISSIGIPQPV